MNIIVGTNNKRKIEAVEAVLNALPTITDTFVVIGCAAISQVADTPLDEDTKIGAINRATHALELHPECTISVGIESGIAKRYGEYHEEVWCAIIKDNVSYTAYSSGIVLPEPVVKQLLEDVSNHPEIMNKLRREHAIDIHATHGVDTWGNYTGNVIVREVGLEEAVRNALVQIYPGDKNFYDSTTA